MKKLNEYAQKIDQNIQFLEAVIQKSSISDSARKDLYHQIERVKKRRHDPNLYLAIIGEFSSGKSTLINALLRDNLLKTSALVTTATATKIIYNNKFSAEALFKTEIPKQLQGVPNNQKNKIKKTKIAWIPSFIIGIPLIIILSSISPLYGLVGLLVFPIVLFIMTAISNKLKFSNNSNKFDNYSNKFLTSEDALLLGISPQQFIHVVTSEEEVARSLDDFKIYHPANFLKSGIVIIDTPGTDAINEEHGKVTQAVVANEADAALIVIPAGKPVSQTLINFLSNSISPYIHRCIFVVTKMDQIRPKEQSKLVKIIEKRLQENLSVHQLFLLEAAPQIVIDILTEEVEVDEKNRHWQDKFVQLEERLREYLENSREVTIAESINRLLRQVFTQLESHLRERQEEFRLKQQKIEQNIIPDLPSFTSEQYQDCSQMIQHAVSQTKSQVSILVNCSQEEALKSLRHKIFNADNKDDLTTILKNQVSPIFENSRSQLNTELTNATNNINQSFTKIKEHFDQKFLQQYQNLQSLATKTNLTSGKSTATAIQVNTSTMLSVASELSKKSGDSSNIGAGFGLGAGAGATIGTFILPGVGTAVGAAVGVVLGSILGSWFGPSLSELQNRSFSELEPKLQDYFNLAEKAFEESLDNYSQQIINELNGHINNYVKTYQEIVNAMKQEQQKEQEILNRLQQDIQADLREINTKIVK